MATWPGGRGVAALRLEDAAAYLQWPAIDHRASRRQRQSKKMTTADLLGPDLQDSALLLFSLRHHDGLKRKNQSAGPSSHQGQARRACYWACRRRAQTPPGTPTSGALQSIGQKPAGTKGNSQTSVPPTQTQKTRRSPCKGPQIQPLYQLEQA